MSNWNYRKRISGGSGTWVNLSKSGASISVGGRGVTVNSGSKGTYVTTSIPGTGVYKCETVSGGSSINEHLAGFLGLLIAVAIFIFLGVILRKVFFISLSMYVLGVLCGIGSVVELVRYVRKRK